MSNFITACRNSIPEGIVLLETDGTLPLKKGEKIALFGRGQFEYLKGGSGSGGRVNCPYVITIPDGLKDQVVLDGTVSKFYEKFIRENPYDTGDGWILPTSQKEPLLTEKFVSEAAKRNDTAIFIVYRLAGEDFDIKPDKGGWYLSDEEEKAVELLSRFFKKFVVLVNSANLIDTSWIQKYSVGTVALIWGGGQEGGNGVADMLMGYNPPSGRLSDTIAKSLEDYPAFGCFGDAIKNVHKEDIFVGYRYFETFAKDRVLYPFGYGLNYTQFTQKILSAEKTEERIRLRVLVKNVGDYKGKDVVQAYFSAPQGEIGKPARELIAFKKTKTLFSGEEEEIELSFSLPEMASYDDSGKSGFAYSWVLEKGTYRIFVGQNVREAKEAFVFDLSETVCVNECEQALAPTEEFERMAAKNGVLSYEKVPTAKYSLKDRMRRNLPNEIPYTGDRGITLQQVKNAEFSLDEFVAQFTAEELSYLTKGEGMSSTKAPLPGTASCFAGVAKPFFLHGVPVISTCDGPSGIRLECNVPATSIPMGTLIACAWSPEAFKEIFAGFAEEMLKYHIDFNLGPGMNIHRYPLCGRNFEYFSEDPHLTGVYATMIAKTFFDKGVFCTLKHFAVNSQEFRRASENEVVSERALREIYLKGFEKAVKSGCVRGIMTSYNRINGISSPSNYDLIAHVLRKEWGYQGFVMTDWWTGIDDLEKGTFSGKNIAAMIEAETDTFMVVPDATRYDDDLLSEYQNGRITLGQLQKTAKNILSVAMESHAFSRGRTAFEENDFSLAKDTVYETNEVKDGAKVTLSVPSGEYVAELTYNIEGVSLAQMTIKVFIDKKDAIILIVNKTEGEDKTTRFRVLVSENSTLWIEGEGIKSLKLLK